MLRVDEVLKIKMSDIKIEGTLVTHTLPFQKTHQVGEIKPFHLHLQLDDDVYLCPVGVLADWISASEIKTGYLFCQMDVSDRVTKKQKAQRDTELIFSCHREDHGGHSAAESFEVSLAPHAKTDQRR
ncbi:hypothetical protein L208DRAFT_1353977 [Tricholoma matsutake]|nr:hypothetical protein L208DRAFT_1353977 [Tricholoma matsutake 945]